MEIEDFDIGTEFYMGGKKWRCTDVGKRCVIAIELQQKTVDDPSWLNGPPYAVAEHILDEDCLAACSREDDWM